MSHALAIIPSSNQLATLNQLAQQTALSQFVPAHLVDRRDDRKTLANVSLVMMMGAEVGLPPTTALSQIAVISGKPSLSAQAMRALAFAAGHQVRTTFTGDIDAGTRAATVTVIRGDDPTNFEHQATYSVADAKRSNLWGNKGPWTQYPDRMLSARATSAVMREACADVLGGMKYTPEEVGSFTGNEVVEDEDGTVIEVRAVTRDEEPVRDPLRMIPVGKAQRELLASIEGNTDIARQVWTAHGLGNDGATRDELDAVIEDAVARLRIAKDEAVKAAAAEDADDDAVDAEVIDDAFGDGPDFGAGDDADEVA